MDKCKICNHFRNKYAICDYCNFEYCEDFKLYEDDWDILNLDDDLEWSHLQIQYRLKSNNIYCTFADIWTDDNLAYIFGCNENEEKIASVLNIHRESIYYDYEHSFVIINLFMEKCLRGYDIKKELDNRKRYVKS